MNFGDRHWQSPAFGVCQAKGLSLSRIASGSDENHASSSPGGGRTRPYSEHSLRECHTGRPRPRPRRRRWPCRRPALSVGASGSSARRSVRPGYRLESISDQGLCPSSAREPIQELLAPIVRSHFEEVGKASLRLGLLSAWGQTRPEEAVCGQSASPQSPDVSLAARAARPVPENEPASREGLHAGWRARRVAAVIG